MKFHYYGLVTGLSICLFLNTISFGQEPGEKKTTDKEAVKDISAEEFNKLTERFKKLEDKYEKLLNKMLEYELQVNSDTHTEKKEKKRTADIDEYLSDYYVDMDYDISKMKEEIDEIVRGTDSPAPAEVKSGVKIQHAMKELHRAQKLYYEKRYNSALKAVNKSLVYQETALGYALEGSILYTLGDVDGAMEAWQAALKLDPEMYEVRNAIRRYER